MSSPDSGFFISQEFVGPPGPVGPVGPVGSTGNTGSIGPTGPSISTVLPAVSKTIYMASYGNDTTGDGSFNNPYSSLAKSASIANGLSTTATPITINIFSGTYTENNSSGPITFTAGGISVVGLTSSSVILYPADITQVLISTTVGVQFDNITFDVVGSSTSTCISCSSLTNTTKLINCRIFNYNLGINFAGTSGSYQIQDCLIQTCTTHINVNSATLVLTSLTIQGSATAVPAGTGIVASGAGTSLLVSGGLWERCTTLLSLANNASIVANSTSFRNNTYDVVALSSSLGYLSGCAFTYGSSSSDITIQVSGAGTNIQMVGCQLSGTNIITGLNQGIGVQVYNGGLLHVGATQITYFQVGANCGLNSADTSSTELQLTGVFFDTCDTDIIQYGLSTMNTNSADFTLSKLTFNDPTNINLNFVGVESNELTIGKMSETTTDLLRVAVSATHTPRLTYYPNFYGADSMAVNNPTENAGIGVYTSLIPSLNAITTDRTKSANIYLLSDTSGSVGSSSALRGWLISKTGTSGNLQFNYTNNDLTGQSAISTYNLISLDGVNKYLSLPSSNSKILFSNDTNLYRSSAGVLRTDENFVIGGLTASTALYSDSNNQITSSSTTNTELGYLSGTTSSIQTQLNSKVSRSGDTMTGTLSLPSGTVSAPALNFTSGTTSGLSFNSSALSFSTQGVERLKTNSSGTTVSNISTGVVHSDSAGLLSSSSIVGTDIASTTIANSNLATVSSADTSSYIVARDSSGNFATRMITIDGTTTASTDVATKSYVDSVVSSGITPVPSALVVSTSNVSISTLQTIDSVLLTDSNRVLLVSQSTGVENGVYLAHTGAWTRPTDSNDFNTGSAVGRAYVLVTNGTINSGSSYLCSTPSAVVGTDPITMDQFSIGGSVTNAENIGSGVGQVFSAKVGSFLDFKTLAQGNGIVLTNNSNNVNISTNATGTNTANTIITRDSSGNFSAGTITANLIGSANQNVLKLGDLMSGNLYLPAGTTLVPSLGFTGSTTTGLSATTNALSLSANATEIIRLSSTGTLFNLLNSAGVVHSDTNGYLSTSLIINADISNSASIVDTKLNTIYIGLNLLTLKLWLLFYC